MGSTGVRRFPCRPAGNGYRSPGGISNTSDGSSTPASVTANSGSSPTPSVGTDSHTPMIGGIGVVGWGRGIEAEAAMLGQPITMKLPEVVGVRLTGELPEGRDRN